MLFLQKKCTNLTKVPKHVRHSSRSVPTQFLQVLISIRKETKNWVWSKCGCYFQKSHFRRGSSFIQDNKIPVLMKYLPMTVIVLEVPCETYWTCTYDLNATLKVLLKNLDVLVTQISFLVGFHCLRKVNWSYPHW